jgi:hypothetical protein
MTRAIARATLSTQTLRTRSPKEASGCVAPAFEGERSMLNWHPIKIKWELYLAVVILILFALIGAMVFAITFGLPS